MIAEKNARAVARGIERAKRLVERYKEIAAEVLKEAAFEVEDSKSSVRYEPTCPPPSATGEPKDWRCRYEI